MIFLADEFPKIEGKDLRVFPEDKDLVDDGFSKIFRHNLNALALATDEDRLLDLEAMDANRARIESIVTDPATAEALKPWYNQMCKQIGRAHV